MERRVNSVGSGTLTISLPAKWARKHLITKGTTINLEERPDGLLVSKHAAKGPASIELDLRGRKEYTRKFLIQAYKKGYDEIIVKYDSGSTLEEATRTLGVLIGFEIIEQTEDTLVFRSMAVQLETDVNAMRDRALQVTARMFENVRDALLRKDPESLQKAIQSEQINNRLCLLTERIIVKYGVSDTRHGGPFLMVMMYKLENIADGLRDFAGELSTKKGMLGNTTVRAAFKSVYQLQQDFMRYHRTDDPSIPDTVQASHDAIREQITASLPQERIAHALTLLLQIEEAIYDLLGIRVASSL